MWVKKVNTGLQPSQPLLESVHKYLMDWEPIKKQKVNTTNYKLAAEEYLRGYRLPEEKRELVETAAMIYAKIPLETASPQEEQPA